MWKWIWYFVIFAIVFLVLGFWEQLGQCGQFHFAYPHEIFSKWELLHSELSSTTFFCVVGNPKIQWNETNRDTEQLIPIGEITSKVMYIFQPRPDDLLYLAVYMYKDKDGYIISYVWDPIKKSYRKLTNNI
jgi:hypothetical protein